MHLEIPDRMTVVSARMGGTSDTMSVETRAVPRPGAGEVLIRVAAAGLNRGDLLQRSRTYPAPPGTDFDVLGLEVSGHVVAVGTDVRAHRQGDPVCALMKEGGYAEYALADAALTLPVPQGVSVSDAASLPEACFTVWANLFQRAGLAEGDSVLVHGGSSGIGVTAIQLARAFGARVFATVGSEAKAAACVRLGAEAAILYRSVDFVEHIHRLTGGRGVDLILDIVAGSYLDRNLRALATDGTVIMIGLMEGKQTRFDITPLLARRLTITGSTLWARSLAEKAAIGEALRTQVWPLFGDGTLRPVVHARYALREAARAHDAMERSEHTGKILLTVEPPA